MKFAFGIKIFSREHGGNKPLDLIPLGCALRDCLLRVGYFGDGLGATTDKEALQMKLDEAYRQFKQWMKTEKISCGQPPFRPGMVS